MSIYFELVFSKRKMTYLGSHSFRTHQPFSNTVCFVRVLKMEEPYGHVPMSHTTLIGTKVKRIILSPQNSQPMSASPVGQWLT